MTNVRKIVLIDETKCNGCGLCVPACHEGAIQIIDGVARLVADKLCDGLGDCLGQCPLAAITIIEREADAYDEAAVQAHLMSQAQDQSQPCNGGCPGARAVDMAKTPSLQSKDVQMNPELTNWPVQLHLIPTTAPYLRGRELLVCADCVPFAYPDFHRDILKGRTVAIACPKLDQAQYYAEKLAEIIAKNNIQKVTVAHMEVPCCSGLVRIVADAIALSGCAVRQGDITITIQGAKAAQSL